jgi:hypothetical protein
MPEIEQKTPTPRPLRFLAILHKRVSIVWVYFAIAIALLNLAYTYRPKIIIDAGIALDKFNPAYTLFRVTNAGLLPIMNVHFMCIINGSIRILDNLPDQRPVPILHAGEPVTRECTESNFIKMPPPDVIDIVVTYEWPIFHWTDQSKMHFIRKEFTNSGQFILVPDVAY